MLAQDCAQVGCRTRGRRPHTSSLRAMSSPSLSALPMASSWCSHRANLLVCFTKWVTRWVWTLRRVKIMRLDGHSARSANYRRSLQVHMLNAGGAFAACACSSAEVWIHMHAGAHTAYGWNSWLSQHSLHSPQADAPTVQGECSRACRACASPRPSNLFAAALRAQRECTVRACEANVCCSSCHNTDAHASAYTCRAHATNDVLQWDARQDEVDHSERLRKLEEELRQMEADREKEVSSLQLESSKGAPPTAVLDSDDEEDALRSRTRSLHVAPRNGVERGSRAGQGWGLALSLSLPPPSLLSLSRTRARARAHTHTHSYPPTPTHTNKKTLARTLYVVQHPRLRAVRIICYKGDDASGIH